ncbi:hypothetical protein HII31_10729 [Pseudocercospora fuligena]|uniref:Uncharacterized protein n=1 Tax=Pseudocercospora fuligena TaxID=685502 RepID=A0A8H6VH24_9PEZI|nr:hypothetical protein HII31_10729 [Pseudocercospora fuligena]
MGISSAFQAQEGPAPQPFAAPAAPFYEEKKGATETVRPVYQETEEGFEEVKPEAEWKPGFVSRFPWLGLGSLLFVLFCLAGNVAILCVSDGMAQSDRSWKQLYHHGVEKGRWSKQIRPSVILSLLNNVANLAFGLAIANGVAIAWWRKALKGATIKQLHNSWNFSSSIKAIALAGKGFNGIALAALMAKFTIIDGILMQSATVTEILEDAPNTKATIQTWSNDTIPLTGKPTSRGGDVQISDYLADELYIWNQSPRVLPYVGFDGCVNATCYAQVPGAGFEFDCEEPTQKATNWAQDLSPLVAADGSATWQSAVTFDISFAMVYGYDVYGDDGTTVTSSTNAAITMNVLYTQAQNQQNSTSQLPTCPGTLFNQTCTLRPAVVGYPVMLQNYGGARGIQSVMLATEKSYSNNTVLPFNQANKQQEAFQVIKTVDFQESMGMFSYPRLGGLVQAFNTYLGGHANTTYDVMTGYSFENTGNAQPYLLDAPDQTDQCGFYFNSPMKPETKTRDMQSLVAMINEIMFSVSMDVSKTDPAHKNEMESVPATIYTESIHYKTKYLYMMGAIISTMVCIACVLPTYWGYWQLGRKVGLGPFEIAHAFRSPMTAQAPNATIDQVIERVGHQKVQYGHIVSGDARGVFGIAEPEYVAGLTTRSSTQELRDKFMHRSATR